MMPPVISCFDIPEEVFEDYIFGRISGHELEEFEEHLVVCQVCANRLTEFRSFIDLLRAALLTDIEPQSAADPATYDGRERRTADRRCARSLVDVFNLSDPAGPQPIPSILTDTSTRGMGLVCRHSMRSGTRVCIELNDRRVHGVVRNTRQVAKGWRVGVEKTTAGA